MVIMAYTPFNPKQPTWWEIMQQNNPYSFKGMPVVKPPMPGDANFRGPLQPPIVPQPGDANFVGPQVGLLQNQQTGILPNPNATPKNQKAAIIMGALSDIFKGQDTTQNTVLRQQQMVAMEERAKKERALAKSMRGETLTESDKIDLFGTKLYADIEAERIRAKERGSSQPSIIQEYEYLRKQKPGLTLEDFYSMKKSTTNINMNQNDKIFDFSLDNLQKDMDAIDAKKELIDRVGPAHELLLSGDVETGWFTEKTLPYIQAFKSMGFDVGENVGEQEFVLATTKWLVPKMREKGSGSTSDTEIIMFEQAAPSFGKTTDGNLILMGTMLQTAERDAELVALKEDYILANNGNVFGFGNYLDQLAQEGKDPKIYESFGNTNDVVTAFGNKQIKDGEVIIMGGKLIVFREDDII